LGLKFRFNYIAFYGLDDQVVRFRVPGWGKNFHFTMSSKSALGPTQPPIQATAARVKAAVAWSKPLTSNCYRGQKTWVYTSTSPYVFMA
jgi:hypothetical protein